MSENKRRLSPRVGYNTRHLFVPIKDNDHYLTWSQLGLTQQDDGLVSNLGLGQRWARGNWLVGYNTFYDNLLDQNLQRAGFGAEAWGE